MPGLAALLIAFKLWMGAIVGAAVTFLAYRARFSKVLAVRGAVVGAVAFIVASSVAIWLGSDAENGLLRWIGAHESGISYLSSCLAALLAGASPREVDVTKDANHS